MYPVRTAARVLIRRDGCVLVTRNVDSRGDWFVLPGGGQRAGESLVECARRECLEETGIDVRVGALRFIREVIAANHPPGNLPPDFHQVEHVFECEMIGECDDEPVPGHEPDTPQTGVDWLPIGDLTSVRFYPRALVPHLLNGAIEEASDNVIYLGDVR